MNIEPVPTDVLYVFKGKTLLFIVKIQGNKIYFEDIDRIDIYTFLELDKIRDFIGERRGESFTIRDFVGHTGSFYTVVIKVQHRRILPAYFGFLKKLVKALDKSIIDLEDPKEAIVRALMYQKS